MLVRFNVENFRSIDKCQSFSMISGNVDDHKERLYAAKNFNLLKFASIWGANASGKSNLINAIAFASAIVYSGTEQYFFCNNRNSYCRFNPSNKDKNSYFEFEILIGDDVYAYGFEISLFQRKIREEWLVKLDELEETVIFQRNTNGTKSWFNHSYLSGDNIKRMEFYLSDYKYVTNKLFLTEIVSNKDDLYKNDTELILLKDLFSWFSNINIAFPNMPVTGYKCFFKDDFSTVIAALDSFDTGISNIFSQPISKDQAFENLSYKAVDEIQENISKLFSSIKSDADKKMISMNLNGRFVIISLDNDEMKFNEVIFEHLNNPNVRLSLGEESDGTQRLLDLLSVILTKPKNSVFVIDELDKSLHPQLTTRFIKTFLGIAKRRNIQLIITTHESRLLNLKLLRRDEIYFIERNSDGSSNIYPFDRYSKSLDKYLEKAYLDGRFGAVPLFDSFFPEFEADELDE